MGCMRRAKCIRLSSGLGIKVMSDVGTRRLIRVAPAITIAWVLVAGTLVLQFAPDLPQSGAQWIFVLAFGPPLYVLAEELFGWLLSAKHGRAISRREFSFARIVVALLAVLVAICGVFGVLLWLPNNLAN
jgi:hypothetical protein